MNILVIYSLYLEFSFSIARYYFLTIVVAMLDLPSEVVTSGAENKKEWEITFKEKAIKLDRYNSETLVVT